MVDFTHPKYWKTPVGAFQALFAEYPNAAYVKTVPALRKDGSVTLFHYPLDADGNDLSSHFNDSNPCPPYC